MIMRQRIRNKKSKLKCAKRTKGKRYNSSEMVLRTHEGVENRMNNLQENSKWEGAGLKKTIEGVSSL